MAAIRTWFGALWAGVTGPYRSRALFIFAVTCLAAPAALYILPGSTLVRVAACATSLAWQSPDSSRLLVGLKVSDTKIATGSDIWEFPPSARPYQLDEVRAQLPYAARVQYRSALPQPPQAQSPSTLGVLELKLLSWAAESLPPKSGEQGTFRAFLYHLSDSSDPWIYKHNGKRVESTESRLQVPNGNPSSRFHISMGLSADGDPSDAFALDPLDRVNPRGVKGVEVIPGSVRFEQELDAEGEKQAPVSTIHEASVDLWRIGSQHVTGGQSLILDPPGITRIETLRLDFARGCIAASATGRTHRVCVGEGDCINVGLLESWMGKDHALDLVKTTSLATIVTLLIAIVRAGVLGGKAS